MRGLARIYGIPVKIEPWLPKGTIMPDPIEPLPDAPDWADWDEMERLRFLAAHSKMLYISEDIADALRENTDKYATER